MGLQDRIAAARQALDAAALSDVDSSEIELREELARIEADAATLKRKKRELELARQLDGAATALDGKARVKPVTIVGLDDTFIIMSNPAAHKAMTSELTRIAHAEANGQKTSGDREAIRVRYAIATVYAWNGVVGGDAEFSSKLGRFLRDEYPGAAVAITNAASELAGTIAEERKS
jgi:hypothetical protein